MAVVASRASLVNALLSGASPANRESLSEFLSGLSCDELQCIAEFQGASILEAGPAQYSEYRLLTKFFGAESAGRWPDAAERAHKTFVLLTWLDLRKSAVAPTFLFVV